jgi:MSHA biogenesis protein MshP
MMQTHFTPSPVSLPSAARSRPRRASERDFSACKGSLQHCSERGFSPRRVSERGFSLLSAIFLLIMLSVLGGALVAISTGSQIAVALDIQGERAYHAARAGIEWGLYRQLRNDSCVNKTSFVLPAGTSSAGASTAAATASTLAGFTVTVTCQVTRTPVFGAATAPGQRARATPLNDGELTLKKFTATSAPEGPNIIKVADTSLLAEGMFVVGNGIAANTRILNVSDGATLMLTDVAGPELDQVTFRSELDRYTLTSTACNQPTAGACPHAANSNHPDYVQRVIEVRF